MEIEHQAKIDEINKHRACHFYFTCAGSMTVGNTRVTVSSMELNHVYRFFVIEKRLFAETDRKTAPLGISRIAVKAINFDPPRPKIWILCKDGDEYSVWIRPCAEGEQLLKESLDVCIVELKRKVHFNFFTEDLPFSN